MRLLQTKSNNKKRKTGSTWLCRHTCFAISKVTVLMGCLVCLGNTHILFSKVKQEHRQKYEENLKLRFLAGSRIRDKAERPLSMLKPGAVLPVPRATPEERRRKQSNKEKINVWKEEVIDDEYLATLKAMEEKLRIDFPVIASCRKITQDRSNSSSYTKFNDNCFQGKINGTQTMLMHNPFHKPRIVCGRRLEGNDILLVSTPPNNEDNQTLDMTTIECLTAGDSNFGLTMDTQLFQTIPSQETASNLPPIEIWDNAISIRNSTPYPDCDIPCTESKGGRGGYVGSIKTIDDTGWKIEFSMEGPSYYSYLRFDPEAHLNGNFYATTSLQSEVPLPYFSFDEYPFHQDQAVNYSEVIHGAVFMAHNCKSHNKREEVVSALIDLPYIRVDSVSTCLNNADPPAPITRGDTKKGDTLRHYLFYLAFENQNEPDYITEKMWGALSYGVVPIYYGADNIHDHAPPNSIINVRDFKSASDLAKYLSKVASNRTLYESYHAWRRQPLPQRFIDKYNFTSTHSVCRMCRWAYAKQYGLGWNHQSQSITSNHIPRTLCYQSNALPLLTHPFRESWFSLNSSKSVVDLVASADRRDHNVCDNESNLETPATKREVLLFGGTMRRTVISRDGIVDIFLEPTGNPAAAAESGEGCVLQLETPLAASQHGIQEQLSQRSKHHYWWQDDKSRITILVSSPKHEANAAQVKDGNAALHLVLHEPSAPLRIRLITENVNTFYENGQHERAYFESTMVEDWLNPIERFWVPPGTKAPSYEDKQRRSRAEEEKRMEEILAQRLYSRKELEARDPSMVVNWRQRRRDKILRGANVEGY